MERLHTATNVRKVCTFRSIVHIPQVAARASRYTLLNRCDGASSNDDDDSDGKGHGAVGGDGEVGGGDGHVGGGEGGGGDGDGGGGKGGGGDGGGGEGGGGDCGGDEGAVGGAGGMTKKGSRRFAACARMPHVRNRIRKYSLLP